MGNAGVYVSAYASIDCPEGSFRGARPSGVERKFNRLRLDLVPGGRHGRSWIEEGGLDQAMAEVVARLVRARANILVAGETGAGKTTFLRTVTDLFDEAERIGVVEDMLAACLYGHEHAGDGCAEWGRRQRASRS